MPLTIDLQSREEKDQPARSGARLAPARRRHALLAMAVVSLLVAGAMALYSWSRYERGLHAAREDIQALVDLEVWTRVAGNRDGFLALQDGQVPGWRSHQSEALEDKAATPLEAKVVGFELYADQAWAEVRYQTGTEQYVSTEFFRMVSDRQWLHTAPYLDYWGQPAVQTLGNITIRYRERDHDFVPQIAARVAAWQAEACPGEACETESLTIHLDAVFRSNREADGGITMPSPRLHGITTEGGLRSGWWGLLRTELAPSLEGAIGRDYRRTGRRLAGPTRIP